MSNVKKILIKRHPFQTCLRVVSLMHNIDYVFVRLRAMSCDHYHRMCYNFHGETFLSNQAKFMCCNSSTDCTHTAHINKNTKRKWYATPFQWCIESYSIVSWATDLLSDPPGAILWWHQNVYHEYIHMYIYIYIYIHRIRYIEFGSRYDVKYSHELEVLYIYIYTIYIYIHTYTHTHTHIYIYIYTRLPIHESILRHIWNRIRQESFLL